ncbi:MAG: hypothetical protein Alpg2KO_14300 [Alphaproteobacteria bacterium]
MTDQTSERSTEQGQHLVFSTGQRFAEMLLDAYRDEQGKVDPATVIGAAACIAGEQVLMDSTDDLMEDIAYVTSCASDTLLFEKGPHDLSAWDCLVGPAKQTGIAENDIPRRRHVLERVVDAIGGNMFPRLSVEQTYWPQEWSPAAAPRFRQAFDDLAEEHGLSLEEEALAASAAAGLLIVWTADALPMKIGLQLAAELMVSKTRMMPLPLSVGRTGTVPQDWQREHEQETAA